MTAFLSDHPTRSDGPPVEGSHTLDLPRSPTSRRDGAAPQRACTIEPSARPPAASQALHDRQPLRTPNDLHASIEHDEHAMNVVRVREAFWIGSFLWPLFFVTDWTMVSHVHEASFASYATIRALAWCGIVFWSLASAVWSEAVAPWLAVHRRAVRRFDFARAERDVCAL